MPVFNYKHARGQLLGQFFVRILSSVTLRSLLFLLRILLLAAVLALGSFTACADKSGNAKGNSTSTLIKQRLEDLPEPDDDVIRHIQDAQQWNNPYVIVNRDDYELILPGRRRTEKRWDLVMLEQALLSLPRERWPLGRVVAIQENGVRSRDDDKRIENNLQELKKMLESHKVRVNLWPTA